jgi:hypothetical protein
VTPDGPHPRTAPVSTIFEPLSAAGRPTAASSDLRSRLRCEPGCYGRARYYQFCLRCSLGCWGESSISGAFATGAAQRPNSSRARSDTPASAIPCVCHRRWSLCGEPEWPLGQNERDTPRVLRRVMGHPALKEPSRVLCWAAPTGEAALVSPLPGPIALADALVSSSPVASTSYA